MRRHNDKSLAAREERWLDLAERGIKGIATPEELVEMEELAETLAFSLWHGRIVPEGICKKLRTEEKRIEKIHGPMQEPDFHELPPSMQDPSYLDSAREQFHKMWGRSPSKREIFDELNNTTVQEGTDSIGPEDPWMALPEADQETTTPPAPSAADMLTIQQAAEYARVTERTIRNWISSRNGDEPMLSGTIKIGRKIRIPRGSLDTWCKPAKGTRTPKTTSQTRPARKNVKRKS